MITDTFDPQTPTLPTQGNTMLQYPMAGQNVPQPVSAIQAARKKGKVPLYQSTAQLGPETRGGLPKPIRPAPLMRPKG